ncbi:hypothetical protein XMA152_001056 [Marinobacterium sp. xm-a-152]|nr:hypothetical protein [Marinobacterium sp. xm-a-152]
MRGISGKCQKSYAPREDGISQGAFFFVYALIETFSHTSIKLVNY